MSATEKLWNKGEKKTDGLVEYLPSEFAHNCLDRFCFVRAKHRQRALVRVLRHRSKRSHSVGEKQFDLWSPLRAGYRWVGLFCRPDCNSWNNRNSRQLLSPPPHESIWQFNHSNYPLFGCSMMKFCSLALGTKRMQVCLWNSRIARAIVIRSVRPDK